MPTLKSIKAKPVTEETWKDFEALFKSKGAPGYCWCMAWRMTKEELRDNNSASRKRFIRKRVKSKTPIGLLAYDGREPIGWCSIAPRETYQRLGGDENIDNVWSIACFYIKKEYRHQGLVHHFIEHAKMYARKNGARYIEAYPVMPDSPSYRFMGFVHSFEESDFKFVKKAGTRRNVMTCKL